MKRLWISEDDIAQAKRARDPARPALRLRDDGPRTRRELFTFLRQRDGQLG